MQADVINIIFGMKVRQARLAQKFTLSEFAQRCELSPSYVTEIEKGRKYPKADKIIRMAGVLGKSYDEMVSIKLGSSLDSLEKTLSSPLFQQFPFEEFGIEASNLVTLFTRAPDKASALLHAILEIGRQYDMKDEHFLRAALRSYQEINANYFQELEEAAEKFRKRYKFSSQASIPLEQFKALICQKFNYALDLEELQNHSHLSNYRSVFVAGRKPKLFLNSSLHDNQLKFLLAREMGYKHLKLKQRSNVSAPDRVESFQQVLNDFKASYFAGALLMPRTEMEADLAQFFKLTNWQPQALTGMLLKYNVTSEMLLYRLSEIVPRLLGIKMHFLRFNGVINNYTLIKHFNMNNLLVPSGIGLDEHYCQRWMAMELLRQMETSNNPAQYTTRPLVGAQISEFYNTQERFFAFGFARPLALNPKMGSSVTVGFRLTSDLPEKVRFVTDSSIKTVVINETCERCPLSETDCPARAAPPIIYQRQQNTKERQMALNAFMAGE